MGWNATHTHTPPRCPLPPSLSSPRKPRAAAAAFAPALSLPGLTAEPPPPRQLPSASWRKSWAAGGAAGPARGGGAEGDASGELGGETKGGRRALGRESGGGGGRVTSGGRRRTQLGCGGRSAQPGGSSAGGRSGRQARPGSAGAAALTSLGAAVPPLESPPWLVRAGGRPRPGLRPAAPGLRSGPGGAARAPRPALDSRWRSVLCASSPGGNNGAGAGAPEAGRGEGSRPPPGVSRPCGPPLRNPAAAPHASRRPGFIALRGSPRRGVPDCSTRTVRAAGRPSDRRKVLGLRCFSSCGARSRPEKARSPQCAKQSLGPVGTLPPSSGHSLGSSARCGWTRVRAPARRRPLPRPPQQYPQERSERCAPARREGSLSHSHPR